MNIKNRNVLYKVKKLKCKTHYCTTCCAHPTLELCAELRGQLFSKVGRSCEQNRTVFAMLPTRKQTSLVDVELVNIYLAKDKHVRAVLTNFLTFIESLTERLNRQGVLLPQDSEMIDRYMKKMYLELHIVKEPKHDTK